MGLGVRTTRSRSGFSGIGPLIAAVCIAKSARKKRGDLSSMMPIRFDPEKDLPPTPFDERICRLALEMKDLGVNWQPHVGCFVWDPDNWIKPESPFPNRIYFVLSLPRFVEIFESIQEMVRKLVWLPTWHQARLLCMRMGIRDDLFKKNLQLTLKPTPTEELLTIYALIINALNESKRES